MAMDESTIPLSLHVPEPGCRPGDQPDFSDFEVPRAGAVRRPEIDTPPEAMRDLAFSIVRVLNVEGQAVGPWADSRSVAELTEGLKHMLTLRAFDERMMMAQRQGKTSFFLQCLGEEAVACAFRKALKTGDMNFPTYRQAGLLIANGYPMETMMNQIYSNANDPIKGRQLPTMYSSKENGFFTISGNLGTQFVQAVGWAMASAISGDDKNCRRLDRRRLDLGERLSLGHGLRLDLPRAGGVERGQQSMGDLYLSGHGARQFGDLCRPRSRFWYPLDPGRRQRLPGCPRGGQMGGRPGAQRHGPTLIEHVTYRPAATPAAMTPPATAPKARVRPGRWATRSSDSNTT